MIPVAHPLRQTEARRIDISTAIERVLGRGTYVLGEEVEAFESEFASYCGVGHGIGVNSGTDAITLCLRGLGIRSGDVVATVSHTAVATVSAVIAAGATPLLVDIERDRYTLDPRALGDVIDERVKAVVVVHLYGHVGDLAAICKIADEWGVPVIEDCAQAAGARWRGQRAGSFGRAACFSFYPTKNLAALGDAGMVITDDAELARRIKRLRQYGWDQERVADQPGVNSRLDEMQAAILRAKLPFLDADNERRREIAGRYSNAFADLPVTTPSVALDSDHAYHLYVLATLERDRLREALAEAGIQTGIHYPLPVHRQPGYADSVLLPPHGLPVTDQVVERIVSLPMFPELTDQEVGTVTGAVTSFFSQGKVSSA